MADDRSVDMAEPRDQPPETGTRPTAIAAGKLSPVQEVQRARACHADICTQCNDIDRERCAEGERLWQAWTTALDDAYRRLHGSI